MICLKTYLTWLRSPARIHFRHILLKPLPIHLVHQIQIPGDLPEEVGEHNWRAGFTHTLHIYLRNNTSQGWQSGTPDPFSPLRSGLTVGDRQAELIRPESQHCLMSNTGREFRDNRWGNRLMLCSWGWTTCQLSTQITITKKKRRLQNRWGLCVRGFFQLAEGGYLLTHQFSQSGANPGKYWCVSHLLL